jgi:hypothetical protein
VKLRPRQISFGPATFQIAEQFLNDQFWAQYGGDDKGGECLLPWMNVRKLTVANVPTPVKKPRADWPQALPICQPDRLKTS